MSQSHICPASNANCNLSCPEGYCEVQGHVENRNKKEMTSELNHHLANISPERLQEITYKFNHGVLFMASPEYNEDIFRDLLAMLHFRDRQIDILVDTIAQVKYRADELLKDIKERDQCCSCKLQTRTSYCSACVRAIMDIGDEHAKQVHEQRWRKLSEEEPKLAQVIEIYIPAWNAWDQPPFLPICFGVSDAGEEWEYWRPIPPLPKDL